MIAHLHLPLYNPVLNIQSSTSPNVKMGSGCSNPVEDVDIWICASLAGKPDIRTWGIDSQMLHSITSTSSYRRDSPSVDVEYLPKYN